MRKWIALLIALGLLLHTTYVHADRVKGAFQSIDVTDNVTVGGTTTSGGVATGTLSVSGTPTFSDNTVNGADLIDNTVISAKILDNSIASSKILDNTITSSKILDNTISLDKIASSGTKDNTTFLRGDGVFASGTDNGTFTATLTGCTDNTTGPVKYAKSGKIVVLTIVTLVCISNTTAATLTGLPDSLKPSTDQYVSARVEDNTVIIFSMARVVTTGVIQLWKTASSAVFIDSGYKGIQNSTIAYNLE